MFLRNSSRTAHVFLIRSAHCQAVQLRFGSSLVVHTMQRESLKCASHCILHRQVLGAQNGLSDCGVRGWCATFWLGQISTQMQQPKALVTAMQSFAFLCSDGRRKR